MATTGTRATDDARTTVVAPRGWALVRRLPHVLLVAEIGVWRSLFLLLIGRRPGRGPGSRAFPYAKEIVPLLWVFVVLSTLELAVVHVLLPWETLRWMLFVFSLWGVTWMLGLLVSVKIFPHLLGDDGLRVRYGATVEVVVPWAAISGASVRRGSFPSDARQLEHRGGAPAFVLPILKQTKVDVELREPLELRLPDGPETISAVRLYAEDPPGLVAAIRAGVAERAAGPDRESARA